MKDVLHFLLVTPPTPPPAEHAEAWWKRHQTVARKFRDPADQALAGGFVADRLSWAFASGYQAATRALVPGLPGAAPVALAATEAGGVHPRAIQTELRPTEDGFRLFGHKTHVTLGDQARTLLVVARQGEQPDGRPNLRVAQIGPLQAGIHLETGIDLPFCPEVRHCALRLDGARVSPANVLQGDGFDRYLRPFRTVEDCHVHAALFGYLMQLARRAEWPMGLRDELVTLLVALRGLCLADPSAPGVHLALGSAIVRTRQWLRTVSRAHWSQLEPETLERWERDRAILDVAGKARATRLERAMERLGLGAKR